METLRALARQVEDLFTSIDGAVEQYSEAVALRCPERCGACCHSPEVSVTLLDALPLALELYGRGDAEFWLEPTGESRCPMFLEEGGGNGRCGVYAHRPTLCRLFGHGGWKRKDGLVQLAMCKVQKSLGKAVDAEVEPPLFETYSRALVGIHPEYGSRMLPIALAIREAIQKILLAAQLESR